MDVVTVCECGRRDHVATHKPLGEVLASHLTTAMVEDILAARINGAAITLALTMAV